VDQLSEESASGTLWERAAKAAIDDADYATAVDYAGRARTHYLPRGHDRAAARSQAIAGRALRRWGRHTEARDQLTIALEVLRPDADTDTVRALEELAVVAVFSGSSDADRLTTEALMLGQALDVDAEQFAGLLMTRGIYLGAASRHRQAIAYFRESARLAAQSGDHATLGSSLLNLSDVLTITDPAGAAETVRDAVGPLHRVGNRLHLSIAIMNLNDALVQLGDWHAAEEAFTQAANSFGLTDVEYLAAQKGWLAALRGDADSAEAQLASLSDLHASEDPQDQSMVKVAAAFTAAARGQPEAALRSARAVLAYADALGISATYLRWAWPLAARASHELGDSAAVEDLIALLDSHQPGHLAPMLRAERDLARARLAGTGFEAAITGLRERSTPYHLAHGLLDHAEHLARHGDTEAAALAIEEARDIGGRLGCQPLLDRCLTTEAPVPLTPP
jgi:tetratricopeptide (TPR) repeat protein